MVFWVYVARFLVPEGDGTRVGFCERKEEPSPTQTGTIPAGSKVNPLQAKAEPISNDCRTSVIFKRVKTTVQKL